MPDLTVFQPLDSANARTDLASDPGRWLPAGSRPAGPDRWHVELRAAGMTRLVRCQLGPAVDGRDGTWRMLRWEPIGDRGDALPFERALPTFDGEIGVHRDDDGELTLVLDGAYDVPLGPIGEAVDALVLGRVARSSAVRLLAEIASRIDQMTRPLTEVGRTRIQ